jgi:hypothetical protein
MFVATYILFSYSEGSLLTHFLIVLLEPAGWFLFWEGLHEVVFVPKHHKRELEFHHKMSKCDVKFMPY